ncbi:hypothetical protein RRG08_003936 [Elysia crispata]|uniref:Uncharacterized protein n=1 Tax=Elysia crispata TaxID=231223 RepID=A0AAE0YBB6_9GAST|nr:hypothetical protein RRG08_003936 [Elysia crispata]
MCEIPAVSRSLSGLYYCSGKSMRLGEVLTVEKSIERQASENALTRSPDHHKNTKHFGHDLVSRKSYLATLLKPGDPRYQPKANPGRMCGIALLSST